VQSIEAEDLELRVELERAMQEYSRADAAGKAEARAVFVGKLTAFSDRVLGTAPILTQLQGTPAKRRQTGR
jgi:hypothetical protein